MTPALELRDVHKRFGKTEIIRGTSLAVHAGERVAPQGPTRAPMWPLGSARLGAA